MFLKKLALAAFAVLACGQLLAQKQYTLSSPDKSIRLKVSVSDSIYYEINQNNKSLVIPSAISLRTDLFSPATPKVSRARTSSHSGVLQPVVWQKNNMITDKYSQLNMDLPNGISLEWRAYDNGVAWRWIATGKKDYKVPDEQASVNFHTGATSWYPEEDGFFFHNERQYKSYKVNDITEKKLASLPVLFESAGTKILLTEFELFNYAGMWVRGNGKGGVRATFPKYPKSKKITSDRDEKVEAREGYIAKIQGSHNFPWRILMIAKDDKDLLTNQLVFQLARRAVGDYNWVKPGKVQWDWWHYNNIYEVDFRAGINNNT